MHTEKYSYSFCDFCFYRVNITSSRASAEIKQSKCAIKISTLLRVDTQWLSILLPRSERQ